LLNFTAKYPRFWIIWAGEFRLLTNISIVDLKKGSADVAREEILEAMRKAWDIPKFFFRIKHGAQVIFDSKELREIHNFMGDSELQGRLGRYRGNKG